MFLVPILGLEKTSLNQNSFPKPNMIAKTGYFDGTYLNEYILKGLGLEWIGCVSKECYENIGFKLFVNFYNSLLKEKKYKQNL